MLYGLMAGSSTGTWILVKFAVCILASWVLLVFHKYFQYTTLGLALGMMVSMIVLLVGNVYMLQGVDLYGPAEYYSMEVVGFLIYAIIVGGMVGVFLDTRAFNPYKDPITRLVEGVARLRNSIEIRENGKIYIGVDEQHG